MENRKPTLSRSYAIAKELHKYPEVSGKRNNTAKGLFLFSKITLLMK
jgi:hypothetical protein